MRLTPRRRRAGFTLIELLVALSAMALLALMGWRGLDGMLRAQQANSRSSSDMLALQTGLAQWSVDLNMLEETPHTNAVDWDGQVLRVTRRVSPGASANGSSGVVVVAWARRTAGGAGQWSRWQSAAVQNRRDLLLAWQQAAAWGKAAALADSGRQVAVTPLDRWEVLYWRNGAWAPAAASSLRAAPGSPASGEILAELPEGIRLVLHLPSSALGGAVTSDWVNPATPGGRR